MENEENEGKPSSASLPDRNSGNRCLRHSASSWLPQSVSPKELFLNKRFSVCVHHENGDFLKDISNFPI